MRANLPLKTILNRAFLNRNGKRNMAAFDLAKQCADSLNFAHEQGLPQKEASICVVTPPGWKAPPKFPRGRIVRWMEDGSRVRYLPALNVLAWLTAHGMVAVQSHKS